MTSPDPAIAAMARQVAELHQKVSDLELSIEALTMAEGKKHKVRDSVKWHEISDEEAELHIARFRGWERDVLLPVVGYYLAPCWPLHRAAVLRIELAFEQWRLLWLSKRTEKILSAQIDYLIRQLPALCDDIKSIASRCGHTPAAEATEEDAA
jgi:hypothetical protein